MENMRIVRPEHLNHHGYLFGGQLLKWVDEFAWIAASRQFSGHNFVTRAMDDIEFTERVLSGSILRFCIELSRKGKTSLTYNVLVFADEQGSNSEKHVFSTKITFVNLDKNGAKKEVGPEKPFKPVSACGDN